MANDDFKCRDCGHVEKRKLPDYVKTSETPCSECGGKMERVG